MNARLVLFGLNCALAFTLGFVTFPPLTAGHLITKLGYYYILGVFAWFCFHAWRLARSRSGVWRRWLAKPGIPFLFIAAGLAFAIWSNPFKHKILYDEFDIQGTAFEMHAVKQVAMIIRAYDIEGSWLPIDALLDKRPFFFPFLISLAHDLTGYRLANAFAVNVLLGAGLLGLVYWFGRELAGRGPALLAVALLATLPLFGQNLTGAGMDLHNLTMIALVACLAALYLRQPDDNRLSLLVLASVLLTESRYESIIFIFPVAALIVLGWMRLGKILLPWPAVVAPLLLVPYAWHNRFLSVSPYFWQLKAGQTSAFGTENVANNLKGAWAFFFNTGPTLTNSWYLSSLGVAGLGWLVWRGWTWWRKEGRPPLDAVECVALAFGAGVAGHFGVLLFYWWARFDDLMASRLALPLCLAFALLAALFARALGRAGWPALRLAAAGIGVWALLSGVPALARRLYTDQNIVMQQVDWEREIVGARPGPVLVITNRAIPFVLWRIPALITTIGAQRGEQIRYHLAQGTFKEVLIAQAILPTSAQGDMGVDPDDAMPPSYHLAVIAEKRFGGQLDRISRLVAIDPAPAAGLHPPIPRPKP